MLSNFTNTNYIFINKTNKIKSNIINIYIDDFYKDYIYVLNSNLIRKSFFRKKQILPSTFYNNIRNVLIYKNVASPNGVFYSYPLYYHKKMIKNLNNKDIFIRYYYKKKLRKFRSKFDIVSLNFLFKYFRFI